MYCGKSAVLRAQKSRAKDITKSSLKSVDNIILCQTRHQIKLFFLNSVVLLIWNLRKWKGTVNLTFLPSFLLQKKFDCSTQQKSSIIMSAIRDNEARIFLVMTMLLICSWRRWKPPFRGLLLFFSQRHRKKTTWLIFVGTRRCLPFHTPNNFGRAGLEVIQVSEPLFEMGLKLQPFFCSDEGLRKFWGSKGNISIIT